MSISFYITFFLIPDMFFILYEKEPGFTISYSKKHNLHFLQATISGEIGLFIEINIQQLGKNNLDLFFLCNIPSFAEDGIESMLIRRVIHYFFSNLIIEERELANKRFIKRYSINNFRNFKS